MVGSFAHDPGSDSAGVLRVLQLNVCPKSIIKHVTGFSLSAWSIGHGLFDTDDLTALRALAEAVTGAIHFILWSKPTQAHQFWLYHNDRSPADCGSFVGLIGKFKLLQQATRGERIGIYFPQQLSPRSRAPHFIPGDNLYSGVLC